jgi:NosR/NirI family nitrous oxide reductase transcriptional regulator
MVKLLELWRRHGPRLAALQLYRLATLVLIALLMRDLHVRVRVDGDRPIALDEVRSFYPQATRLRPDPSGKRGLFVLDREERELGYVVRTSPSCDRITGYSGPTDTLVALSPEFKVLGFKIRRSVDTKSHVEDVARDRHFKKTWNGMAWDEVANLNLKQAGIEGVSGATLTSMAIAEAVTLRFRQSIEQEAQLSGVRVRARDIGTTIVIVMALVLAFTNLEKRKWVRHVFQIGVIVYLGFINGDLVAQSLLAGWAGSNIPWNLAPGLVLLVAASLVIPWTTRRPFYCLHLCPHGAAQELLGRLTPQKLRVQLPNHVAKRLRLLPAGLLLLVLVVAMLNLPLDLADLEPFDAYIIKSTGIVAAIIAVLGLIVSFFIPQAYCRFGCPTGALLEFLRWRGPEDRFGKREVFAALLVALAAVLNWNYTVLHTWITGMS